jgi:hypothetical protein
MINRLLVAALTIALSWLIAPAADAQTPLMVSVTYWKRSSCEPIHLAQTAPVTAGMLQIRDNTGAAVRMTLGPKPVSINGAILPLTATLLLQTPRVKVVSGAGRSGRSGDRFGPSRSSGGNRDLLDVSQGTIATATSMS